MKNKFDSRGRKAVKLLTDSVFYLLGGFIYAVGVSALNSPNHIAPGGLTGISTVLNFLFKLPIGTMILLLNVPLFIIAYKTVGRSFIVKSCVGALLTSVFIDLLAYINFPVYHGDTLLAALFGGLLNGAGMSLIFMCGGTTGGTDIAALLLSKKIKQFSMGRLILFIDVLVIAFAAIAYRDIEAALYSAIALFVSTRVIDAALYGLDKGKVLFIVTGKRSEITKDISNQMTRGMTVLNGTGSYTGKELEVIICAVRPSEVYRARNIVKGIDPDAFIMVMDAHEIIGQGFNSEAQIKEYMQ